MASATSPSPYYPPRARWYSPALYGFDALRRRLGFRIPRLPAGLRVEFLFAGFVVPGLAVFLRSPNRLGKAALLIAALLATTFVIELGHTLGNLAFGMLLSLHASGLVYYCTPWIGDSLPRRLTLTVASLLALGFLLYAPARTFLQSEVLMPLQIKDQVVIVRPLFPTDTIRAGDWVAYNVSEDWSSANDQTVAVAPGLGLRPVLAIAGDFVEFSPDTFSVNGETRPRLPGMPKKGALTVPPKHCFIWPALVTYGHGSVAEARITSTLLDVALVNQAQLIGKPFHRWLWRRQILL